MTASGRWGTPHFAVGHGARVDRRHAGVAADEQPPGRRYRRVRQFIGVALASPVGASPSGTIPAGGVVTSGMPAVRTSLMQCEWRGRIGAELTRFATRPGRAVERGAALCVRGRGCPGAVASSPASG